MCIFIDVMHFRLHILFYLLQLESTRMGVFMRADIVLYRPTVDACRLVLHESRLADVKMTQIRPEIC